MKSTTAFAYLKFNFLYFLQRKFEFIKNNKLKRAFKLLFLIQVIISIIFLFITSFVITSYAKKYIDIIEYYYYLIFLYL